MASKTVEVDIDIDEFDTDELIDEIISRLKASGKKKVKDADKKELTAQVKDLAKSLNVLVSDFPTDSNIAVKSLEDSMKYDHFAKVFQKYSAAYIEKVLPE